MEDQELSFTVLPVSQGDGVRNCDGQHVESTRAAFRVDPLGLFLCEAHAEDLIARTAERIEAYD